MEERARAERERRERRGGRRREERGEIQRDSCEGDESGEISEILLRTYAFVHLMLTTIL